MKHRQDNSNAWKKIGLAVLFITVVFGGILFFEEGITGLATSVKWNNTPVCDYNSNSKEINCTFNLHGLKWTTVDKCTKGNDYGSDEFISGTVIFTKKGKSFEYTDICSKDGKKVTEYYCNKGKEIARKQISCTKGCSKGACLEPAEICYQQWSCSSWGECVAGKQKRVCKQNNCGELKTSNPNIEIMVYPKDAESKKCILGEKSLPIAADLVNYPDPLFITDGVFNGIFVVGDTASSSDTLTMIDIANNFNGASFPVTSSKLSSEVTNIKAQNAIVIGNPCNNPSSAELLGNPSDCLAGFTPGKAMIKLFENNGKVSLLVAGFSDDDTRAAGKALANYKLNKFSGKQVTVERIGSINEYKI